MLDLGPFHKLLIDRWKKAEDLAILMGAPAHAYGTIDAPFPLVIWPGGRNPESPLLPYVQYDLLFEQKYKAHQIFSCTEEPTPGVIETHYKNPSSLHYQYSFIGSADDKYLRQSITLLYNYMTTKGFKVLLDSLKIGLTIMSPIQELILNKQECLERRFFFDIRLNYSDNFTEDESDVGVIETVNPLPLRVPAEDGL